MDQGGQALRKTRHELRFMRHYASLPSCWEGLIPSIFVMDPV